MQIEIKLLDHGYLKYIEHWGSDERIVESARMSTDKGFIGWGSDLGMIDRNKSGDEKLLRYLYSNYHDTPFEMAGIVIEVQAPIMVFREWMRHRTQSYSELSARYTPLPDTNYIPTVGRLLLNSKTNKQAGTIKGAEELTEDKAEEFRRELYEHYFHCQLLYEKASQSGVPKELARVHLPIGRYSRMRASANLRNWLAFMTLRSDSHAQWEIRQYSLALGTIVAELYPRTWALFAEWFEKKTPRL